MLKIYSMYFKHDDLQLMKNHNMKIINGLQLENAYGNIFVIYYLETVTQIRQAKELILSFGIKKGSIDLSYDLHENDPSGYTYEHLKYI